MEMSVHQQIIEALGKAKKILVVLPKVSHADSVAAGLALTLFLKKTDKDVVLVSSSPLPENLKFLPGSAQIQSSVENGQSLVVVLDTSQKSLDELSYQARDNKVEIFLKSKTSLFIPADVSFGAEKFPLDAIVCLDCKSLEDAGEIFENNTDLFFETPKINIDHKPGNEYFGNINLVDVTASSVSEILSGLFEKFENQLVDEDIATCLLTGIIAKTESFQHVRTTPKAFLQASQLVSLGGRQQEVIKHIYKTKSLPLLKLWGRVLAKLKTMDDFSLAYATLDGSDFEKTAGSAELLPAVLNELLDNTSGYRLVAILAENGPGKIGWLLAMHQEVDSAKVLAELSIGANFSQSAIGQYQIFSFSQSAANIGEAESKLLQAAKKI